MFGEGKTADLATLAWTMGDSYTVKQNSCSFFVNEIVLMYYYHINFNNPKFSTHTLQSYMFLRALWLDSI